MILYILAAIFKLFQFRLGILVYYHFKRKLIVIINIILHLNKYFISNNFNPNIIAIINIIINIKLLLVLVNIINQCIIIKNSQNKQDLKTK